MKVKEKEFPLNKIAYIGKEGTREKKKKMKKQRREKYRIAEYGDAFFGTFDWINERSFDISTRISEISDVSLF